MGFCNEFNTVKQENTKCCCLSTTCVGFSLLKKSEPQLKERKQVDSQTKETDHFCPVGLATDGEGETLQILRLQLGGDGTFSAEKECQDVR